MGALLFLAAKIANAFSSYGEAWLARRLGLLNTMVFTHIPSSLFLVGVGAALKVLYDELLFVSFRRVRMGGSHA